MQIVSIGDNLHEMSDPVFCKKNKKNISKCPLLKILPRVLGIKSAEQVTDISPKSNSVSIYLLGMLFSGTYMYLKKVVVAERLKH